MPQISLYSSTANLWAVWYCLSVGDTKCNAIHRVCCCQHVNYWSKSGSRRDRASVNKFKEEINVSQTGYWHQCSRFGINISFSHLQRGRRCRWRAKMERGQREEAEEMQVEAQSTLCSPGLWSWVCWESGALWPWSTSTSLTTTPSSVSWRAGMITWCNLMEPDAWLIQCPISWSFYFEGVQTLNS